MNRNIILKFGVDFLKAKIHQYLILVICVEKALARIKGSLWIKVFGWFIFFLNLHIHLKSFHSIQES